MKKITRVPFYECHLLKPENIDESHVRRGFIFPKNKKKLRGEYPDMYQHDNIDENFRVQVIHIVEGTIGTERRAFYDLTRKAYEIIYQRLCTEHAVRRLDGRSNGLYSSDIFNYFLREENHEKCLDVIELSCLTIDGYVRQNYQNHFKSARGVYPKNQVMQLRN